MTMINKVEHNFYQQLMEMKTLMENGHKEEISSPYYFLTQAIHNGEQSNIESQAQQSYPWHNIIHPQVYDIESIRADFPILNQKINGKPLIWLDNGATTQKPKCVMDALVKYYCECNSNVHRGAHTLAKKATDVYEGAREKVKEFIGASSADEIIFVRGTTEAINLISQTYGVQNIGEGDEVLVSMMEHHSNIVPWQILQKQKKCIIKVIPVNDQGEIDLDEFDKLLSHRTKIVAITHVSNVLGTINPVKKIISMAREKGAKVLVDGAQAVPHTKVNVTELDADFYTFSGHKVYGPTGIGVLYGKKSILEEMPPWQTGGGMIKDVSFENTEYNGVPHKFEAGTGNIADAAGLKAALEYVEKVGIKKIEEHEKNLTRHAMAKLKSLPGVKLIGNAKDKTSVVSFTIASVSPQNVAEELDKEGIAVRVGHHCAQPALSKFGETNIIRASLGMYNTLTELEFFIRTLYNIIKSH